MAVQTFYSVNLPQAQAKIEQEYERMVKHSKTAMDNTMLAVLLLNMEGFNTGEVDRWRLQYPNFVVKDMKDFTKIHAAIGECEEGGIEPADGADGRERLVTVTVHPKDPQFKHLGFKYDKQLPKPDKRKPASEQPKCRLKTVTRKVTIVECNNS